MNNRFLLRTLCCLLGLIIVITAFPFSPNTSLAKEDSSNERSFSLIPEVMENDEEILKGSVIRIDSDEDPLNVLRYLESWNSQKAVIFPVDVKYFDQEGTLKDKSNKLYSSNDQDYVFETRDNDIITKFASDSQNGILTTYLDYSIMIKPDSTIISEAELEDNRSVVYRDAYEDGVDFKVMPAFIGSKTDIVLNRKPSSNKFRLKVNMPGCELINNNNTVCFQNNGDIVCSFSEVYVKDSYDSFVFGSMNVIDNSTVEIEISDDFLESPNTSYPVTIDPVLYFVKNNAYESDNIITAQLASFYCMTGGTITKSSVMMFGQAGTSNLEHPIIRFPHLYYVLQNMNTVQGASLTLFRESVYNGSENTTITAKPITTNWAQTYYNASDYTALFYATSSDYNASSTLRAGASASGSNSFNITNLVNYWRQGNWKSGGGVFGISFEIDNYSSPASFHGALTAYANKMPRLSISHSYTATGQIQDGIYFIKTSSTFSGGVTNYCITRATVGNSVKAVTSIIGNVSVQNYPASNNGYISKIRDLNQLYQINYTSVGYTIKCIKTNQYLAFQNSSDLCYVDNDDTLEYTTRWSFVKVRNKYYIVSYFGHYLSVETPNSSCDVDVNLYTESDGILWSLTFYCFDLGHIYQAEDYTCGVASARMVLSYFGVNTSNLTDDYLWRYGLYLIYGEWYTHDMPVFPDDPSQIDPSVTYRPEYGVEEVAKTIIHYLDNTNYSNAYSMSMLYLSPCNKTIFTEAIENNIEYGFPTISLIKIKPSAIPPFLYSTGGHFVVVIGLYRDPDGNYNVVIADPHKNTNPSTGTVYAFVEVPMDTFYELATKKAKTLIRHSN